MGWSDAPLIRRDSTNCSNGTDAVTRRIGSLEKKNGVLQHGVDLAAQAEFAKGSSGRFCKTAWETRSPFIYDDLAGPAEIAHGGYRSPNWGPVNEGEGAQAGNGVGQSFALDEGRGGSVEWLEFSTTDGGYGGGAFVIHADSSHSEYVSVPDADLLFRGDYHRAGPDLVLTGHDGRHHIVPGYFASEKHAALVAPNGASLSADVVDLLAGSPAPGQYAQAQPTTPPDSIGKLEKVVGDVTVVRNGVSVALHVGDAVFKSDVIATGGDSSAGITFPDGTVLDLVANSRMALNEYSFEPNGGDNGAVFTLVEGTFGFVAGQVAHDNHMSVVTPVATMGIRGTAGIVRHEFRANAGDLMYSFLVLDEVDIRHHGHKVGAYEVRDNRPDSPTFGEILQLHREFGICDFYRAAGPRPAADRPHRGDHQFAVVR